MKKAIKYNYSIVLLVAMILIGAAVVALLCGSAVSTARKASKLSEAVILASSASDLFYEASDENQHHEMLKELSYTNGLSLSTKYGQDGNISFAIIDVISDGETIYSLNCEKYTGEGK